MAFDFPAKLHCSVSARLFLAYRLHVEKTMLGNIEVVAVRVRAADFRVRSPVRARLRQFRVIDFLHSFHGGLAVLDLKAEMIKTIGRILLVIGKNGEIEIAIGQKDGALQSAAERAL